VCRYLIVKTKFCYKTGQDSGILEMLDTACLRGTIFQVSGILDFTLAFGRYFYDNFIKFNEK